MEIHTYLVNLPDGINEAVTPCFDGYTIYINANLTYECRMKSYAHALSHIEQGDFEKTDVQTIEALAHVS